MAGPDGTEFDGHPEIDDEFLRTPADLDVHHRVVREVVCSLPRVVGCRVCPGEHDCPFIVDRPLGHLVVHKRPPHPAVTLPDSYRLTGRSPSDNPSRQWPQVLVALVGWTMLVLALVENWIFHFPGPTIFMVTIGLLAFTFLATIVGVPLTRRTWRDRGGTLHHG